MPFRVAISGLNAASSDLNVIGNNVANANTAGFKKSRAEFADVLAVSSFGLSGNTAGSGVTVERIAQQFSQGNIAFTDNSLDMAISGEGFFVLEDSSGQVYSRAGAFGVDRNGNIVNAQGQRLMGFSVDAAGNISGATSPLVIDNNNIAPRATTQIGLEVNLDAEAQPPAIAFSPTDSGSYNNSTSTTIFDSLGNSHLATTYYVKDAAPNTWSSYLYVNGALVDGPDTLTFNDTGTLTAPAGGVVTSPPFTPGGGAAAMTIDLNYGATTQFGAPFSVFALTQDGFATGQLSGIDIDSAGVVFSRFTNGESKVQGQVALGRFPNSQGLRPLGDNNWSETFTSGALLLGSPGSAGFGLLQSGALEESNVDIAAELVEMIIAQRNYQANAEVISTADTVTQTIINIR